MISSLPSKHHQSHDWKVGKDVKVDNMSSTINRVNENSRTCHQPLLLDLSPVLEGLETAFRILHSYLLEDPEPQDMTVPS